ncbi:lipopolysaccharide biosynthesis protein [Halogeometricum limi]|uniref:Polysaccharide transporter, PST family n=1 Tax=Halogeometricum limi TaxID=555875 RepID=A0A1I6G1F4_9EURY|nr:lipopolysaccharide biosynthesis protein [Halogeometricum limi]SFR36019.1 polysaccharide transporter, PST family [Halogeometricum limi]
MIDRLRRAVKRLSPGGTVAQRAIKGGAWVGSMNVLGRVLQLATILVLARLLGPTAFGVFGIATLAIHAFQRLTQMGLDEALVSNREDDVNAYLDTAWTLRLIRGLTLAAVVYFSAPFIGSVFDAPNVVPVIRVLGIVPLLGGIQNPGIVYFSKDMAFHKQFGLQMGARLFETAVSLGIALYDPTIWALVGGLLANKAARVVVSYLLHDYRPRVALDVGRASEMLDYGRWIFVSGALSYLSNEGDDAFVGWFLGSTALGYYTLAFRLSNAPATEVTHTISQTVFPAYAKLQDELESLKTGYANTLQVTTLVSFPMAAGIAVVAEPFTRVVLGTDWLPMVVPLQLLAVYGLLRSVRSTAIPLFRAVGKPNYETVTRTLNVGVMFLALYPLSAAYGLAGTVGATVVGAAIATPVAGLFVVRILEGGAFDLLSRVFYPAAASALMLAAVVAVQNATAEYGALVTLVLSILTGAVVYPVVVLLADRQFDVGLDRLVQTVKNGVR